MSNRRSSLRKSVAEKQRAESEDKDKSKRKEHHSSSRRSKSMSSKFNTTSPTPDKHIHFDCRTSYKDEHLGTSSSSPKEAINCCKQENISGVSIKDVGIDIAGFLIEEEIKQNKEKVKLEIIRQIALSRELDKHLERQRHIMNSYICNSAIESTSNEYPSQNINDFIDKCNCMVCREAAMENLSTSSRCIRNSSFSEKSLQVNRTGSISSRDIPAFENVFSQSAPLTKDVSCQDICQECNEPNKIHYRSAVNVKCKCTPLHSAVATNTEQYSPQIEGYFEDYSTILNANPADYVDRSDVPAKPVTRVSTASVSPELAGHVFYESSGPAPFQSAEPALFQSAEPAPFQSAEPAPFQTAEPAYIQSAETAPFQSVESAPFQSAEPAPFQTARSVSFQSAGPAPLQSAEPAPFRSARSVSFQSDGPAPFRSAGSVSFQSAEPAPFRTARSVSFQSAGPAPFRFAGSVSCQSAGPAPFQSAGPAPFQSASPVPFPSAGPANLRSDSRVSFPSIEPTPYEFAKPSPYESAETIRYLSPEHVSCICAEPIRHVCTNTIPIVFPGNTPYQFAEQGNHEFAKPTLLESTGPIPRVSTTPTPYVSTGPVSRVSTGTVSRISTGTVYDVPTVTSSRVSTGTISRVSTGTVPRISAGFGSHDFNLPAYHKPIDSVSHVSTAPAPQVSTRPTPNVPTRPAPQVPAGLAPCVPAEPAPRVPTEPVPAVINQINTVTVNDEPINVQNHNEFGEQKKATTEPTDQMLNNLNNLLRTPLNTIEPQTTCQQNSREDITEMILCNIKNIIHDYMENMNLKCNKCQSDPRSSREEINSIKSYSSVATNNLLPAPVKKKVNPTKCENEDTHIDIVMQFCETNNKKKAILEIEPCFDVRKCMKYAHDNNSKKKVCGDMDICSLSSSSELSLCKSQYSNASCRKFSPYPLKDRTFRKSIRPKSTCHSQKQSEKFCKQKQCQAMKTHKKTSNFTTKSCCSNHSIEIIKVNRGGKVQSACASSSSGSNETNRKICKAKKSSSRKHQKKNFKYCGNKSTVCTYSPTLGKVFDKQSKQIRKTYTEQTSIPYSSRHANPGKKQEHKSNKNLDHRSHKSKRESSLNSFVETTKKNKKHERAIQIICSAESSNLEETSYREFQEYEKSRLHSKKCSTSRKTSNTCTTISLNLEGSNPDILGQCSTKKNYGTTSYAHPSDKIKTSEQWFIDRLENKNETLVSSNRARDTNLSNKKSEQRLRKLLKDSKNVIDCVANVSSSSDPSIDKSEIIQKLRNKYKAEIKIHSEEAKSDSSSDESLPVEGIKTYTKINSEAGADIVSPSLETRIQLIQNWLSYMHDVHNKDHLKKVPPTMGTMKLPTSSKYQLPRNKAENDDFDQKLQHLLTSKPVFSNQFTKKKLTTTNKQRGSLFEKFNKSTIIEDINENICTDDGKNTVYSKWTICQKGKNFMASEDPTKRTAIRQNNKNNCVDLNKSKSEVLYTDSSSSSDYNIIGSSLSDSSFDTTSESILDVNENNHDELIQELICPNKNHFKGKYFDVNETDRIINRAFYIQDIFVKLASTEEEKEYWRDTVLRAMKNIVTKTS